MIPLPLKIKLLLSKRTVFFTLPAHWMTNVFGKPPKINHPYYITFMILIQGLNLKNPII